MPPYSTGLIVQMHHLRPQAAEQTDQRQQGAQLLQRMLAARVMGMAWCVMPRAWISATAGPSMVATCTS